MRTCLICCFVVVIFCLGLNVQSSVAEDNLLFIDDGQIRVGIDSRKGAAITWLSSKSYPQNMVNLADPGRLIQQSYYAGKLRNRQQEGQHVNWSPWSWNPIQGGGVGSGGPNGTWANVTVFKGTDKLLYSETIPKLWDMKDEEAEAVMKQWTEFENGLKGVARVRCEVVCDRQSNDAWGPVRKSPQEVPACYFTRRFSQTASYLGDGKWQSETQAPGPPWGKAKPPLKAMAAFDSDGLGIGVFSPTSDQQWNFGPHAAGNSGDPMSGPCVHIAPISRVNLGPKSTFGYRYWLVVGDRQSVAAKLDELIQRHSNERSKLTEMSEQN